MEGYGLGIEASGVAAGRVRSERNWRDLASSCLPDAFEAGNAAQLPVSFAPTWTATA
jgi:hypothetical protein